MIILEDLSLSEDYTCGDEFDILDSEPGVFNAKVIQSNAGSLWVIGIEENENQFFGGEYWVSLKNSDSKVLDEHGNNISLQDISRGATVTIVFSGLVLESHPAQIDGALSIQLVYDTRPSVRAAFDAIVIEPWLHNPPDLWVQGLAKNDTTHRKQFYVAVKNSIIETEILNPPGEPISLQDLSPGTTVHIVYEQGSIIKYQPWRIYGTFSIQVIE